MTFTVDIPVPPSRGISYFRLLDRKDGSKRRQPYESWVVP